MDTGHFGKRSGFINRTRITRLMASALLISIIIMLLFSATPVAAQSVVFSAYTGSPGSSIPVSGSGFNNGDTYQITFAPGTLFELVLVPTTVISGSSFSTVINIPTVPSGDYTIRVATNRGNFSPTFRITPKIELFNTSGNVGQSIAVTGAGFRANITVSLIFNNTSIATTTSSSYGNLITFTFQVPELPGGSYQVYARDGIISSSVVAFAIQPDLTLSSSEGSVGDQITLDGTGFDNNSSIVIYWDSQILSQYNVYSDARGTFSANLVIPSSSSGSHTIRARDASFDTDTASFTLRPSITLNPSSGIPGGTVQISGQGFRPSVSIHISYSGSTISTTPSNIYTDIYGSFTASFTVPSIVSGNYAVRADDGIYSATSTFGIISNIELSPASGHVGSELTVNGTGFTPGGRVRISYDGQTMITVTSDSAGAFSVSFNVPVSTAGQHNVSASDITTQGVMATAVFTMESNPPPVPNLLTPEYGSLVSVRPRFTWSQVSDPSGVTYNIQIAWDAAFSQLVLSEQGLSTPEYQITQAEELELTKKANPYYWRVQAVDRAGNASAWTSPGSFYTQDSTPPQTPILFLPEYDSQTSVQPKFDWSDVTDPSGVTYSLQVARDANFSQLSLYKQGLNVSEYQVTQSEKLGLTKKDSPYYWRVRAVDGADNDSQWTSAASFYTEDSTPPDTPVALNPENGSRQGSDVTFDWTDVSDPSGVTYTLQVAQDSSFNFIVVYKEGVKDPEYRLTEMERLSPTTGDPQSPYYWRVKSVDGADNESNWSIISTFYVGGFLQAWWIYLLIIGGILLLLIGVFVGMRLRPSKQ
jgi:hypothetical protein